MYSKGNNSQYFRVASKVVLVVKNPSTKARDVRNMGSVLGSGRSPGGGNGNPLQYSHQDDPWTEKPGRL